MNFSPCKAAGALNVELGVRAEDTVPAVEFFPGQLPDAGVVLRRHGIGVPAAVHDMAHHGLLEGLRVHGLGQMVGDVGDPVPDGLDALGGDLVAVRRGGLRHLPDVRVKQQGPVVHDAVSQPVLGVAGKFPAVDGQVIAAVEGGADPHLPQRADHRGDVLAKLGLLMLDEGKLPAAQVRIDGAAAAHAAHQMDAVGVGIGLVDLLQHVLVFAHHQRGRGAPEQKHRVRQALFHREVVLKAEVVVNVRGAGLNIDHARPPEPPRPYRSCGPEARRPHGGSP